MIAKLKHNITHNILNIPGWRTKRKIVVIESDDWGSIRMPSREVYLKLLNTGISVDKCSYCRNDSIETEEDLTFLFEVLSSVKDKNGNPAIFTANAVVTNPDFEKIKSSNFSNYYYKQITECYKDFPGSKHSLDLIKEGIDSRFFKVQSHGREHLNISRWMKYLKEGYKETRKAFDLGVYGISTTITSEQRKSFLPAFDFDNNEEEQLVNQIAVDGLQIFEDIFGYKSKSFIAPNYTWGKSLEKTIKDCSVEFIQGTQLHRYVNTSGSTSPRRLRYFGKKNEYGQIDLVRNAYFEPTENLNKDWVNSCMLDVKNAFRWGRPAVICSHRVNYMGGLNVHNRDNNLRLLNRLLSMIVKNWPNVEFMSSDQLGVLLKYNRDAEHR